MLKKVLIIGYYLPPYPGIGGRRWVKFAKYLSKMNWEVHTLGCVNPTGRSSDWIHDFSGYNIEQHSLEYRYPKIFGGHINTFYERLSYKFFKTYYSLTNTKRLFDATFLSESIFKYKVKRLLCEHDINNVIISAPPHYYLSYLSDLRRELNFNYIVDFRDPWIGAVNFGLSELSGQRLLKEKEYAVNVFRNADHIISPSLILLENLAESIQESYDKLKELKHAYDDDDFVNINTCGELPKDKIILVYGGALYMDTEPVINGLIEALDYYKKYEIDLYSRLNIRFFTPEYNKRSLFSSHGKVVSFSSPVGVKIFEKLSNCTFPIVLLAEHNRDYRTTKYYEYLLIRKPYLLLAPKGVTSQYTQENGLGIWIDSKKSFIKELRDVLMNIDRVYSEFNHKFDVQTHSYQVRTYELEKLLIDKHL